MTDRGKLVCWECDWMADYIDEGADSVDFWCQKHCPSRPPEHCTRYYIKQELVSFADGSQIWYPSCSMKNGQWKGWPFVENTDHWLWAQWGPGSNMQEKSEREQCTSKKWWQFWK